MAAEHDDAYCTEWILDVTMNYTADQLVFLNESDKDDRVVLRRYGRAPSGRDTVHHVSLSIAEFGTASSLLFFSVVT